MAKNPISCGADGLLGDAHDAADVAVFQSHLVEDEERLRVGERSSRIEGFSPSPAFLSETFCNFAAKQALTMEQKFGKNSIDIEALREFCEREGKMVTYRKGDQLEREGDPARWFGFVTEGCFR